MRFVLFEFCGRTKGSLVPCLVAARTVRWRPRPAGTRQYIVDRRREIDGVRMGVQPDSGNSTYETTQLTQIY